MDRRVQHLYFFLGGDPAPSETFRADDGALIVGAAYPKRLLAENEPLPEMPADWNFDFVYGRVFNASDKLSAREWSGYIHWLDQRFGFEKIVLDAGAGGGGTLISRELRAKNQLVNGQEMQCVPLCDQVDGPRLVVRGRFIVHLFKRGDPGVDALWPDPNNSGKSLAGDELLKDALYASGKDAIDHQLWGEPGRMEEWLAEKRAEFESWPIERQWALKVLDAGLVQLVNILVETQDKDGQQVQVFGKRGARKFICSGRDDIASAKLYCWAAFLMWLRSDTSRQRIAPEDEAGGEGDGGYVDGNYAMAG